MHFSTKSINIILKVEDFLFDIPSPNTSTSDPLQSYILIHVRFHQPLAIVKGAYSVIQLPK